MPPRFQHLLETRFSVVAGAEDVELLGAGERVRVGDDGFSREWLHDRLNLWRRFCLPSVAAQTNRDFAWLVLCDESTDAEVVAALRSHERDLPMLEVVTTAARRAPRAVVAARLHPETDVLVTTWLDSDDAIADRFVESLQGYAEPFAESGRETLVVNFPRGYRLDVAARTLYEDHMPNSTFASLFERPRSAAVETVLGSPHVELPHRHLTHQDESLPAWLIAVHGGNVVNRIGPREPSPLSGSGPIPGFPRSVTSP